MMSPVLHRRWAREYLVRAQQATSRRRGLDLLRLAVSNSMRAQELEAEAKLEPGEVRFMHRDMHRSKQIH
jgi:hypothetical protein